MRYVLATVLAAAIDVVFHEGGHAIAALLFGAHDVSFGVGVDFPFLGFATRYQGAFAAWQTVLIGIAGSALALVAFFVAFRLTPPDGSLAPVFRLALVIFAGYAWALWIVPPLLLKAGIKVSGFDAVQVIRFAGVDPALVGLLALGSATGYLVLLLRGQPPLLPKARCED